MRDDLTVGEPRQDSGHGGRAGSRAASLRLACAAIPNSEHGLGSRKNLHKFRVDALGKGGMSLDLRSDTQHKLVAMEREAYGIAQMVESPEDDAPVDPIEGARRVAFVLARAIAALSSHLH